MESSVVGRYLAKTLELNILDVKVDHNSFLNEDSLVKIEKELNAKNLDFNSEQNYANGALILQKLREHKPKLIENMEKSKDFDILKAAAINYTSQNYSENISLKNYLNLFKEPSLKELTFVPHKYSNRKHLKQIDYAYFLNRTDNFNLQIKDINDSDKTIINISFEESNLPKLKYSEDIIKHPKIAKQDWPYPLLGDSETQYYMRESILGSELGRKIPKLYWYDVDLRSGEFDTEKWFLFIDILSKNKTLYESLDIYSKFSPRGLRKLNYLFSAPVGEFDFSVMTANPEDLRDYTIFPDLKFNYQVRPNNSEAKLILKRAHIK